MVCRRATEQTPLRACDFCPNAVHLTCVGLGPLPVVGGSDVTPATVMTSAASLDGDGSVTLSGASSSRSSSGRAEVSCSSFSSAYVTSSPSSTPLPQLCEEDLYACPECARVYLTKEKLPFPPLVDAAAEAAALAAARDYHMRGNAAPPERKLKQCAANYM